MCSKEGCATDLAMICESGTSSKTEMLLGSALDYLLEQWTCPNPRGESKLAMRFLILERWFAIVRIQARYCART